MDKVAAAPSAPFSHGYALLIGIGADLPITIQDAASLRNVLIDPSRAGYPVAHVQFLTEKDATRECILAIHCERHKRRTVWSMTTS